VNKHCSWNLIGLLGMRFLRVELEWNYTYSIRIKRTQELIVTKPMNGIKWCANNEEN